MNLAHNSAPYRSTNPWRPLCSEAHGAAVFAARSEPYEALRIDALAVAPTCCPANLWARHACNGPLLSCVIVDELLSRCDTPLDPPTDPRRTLMVFPHVGKQQSHQRERKQKNETSSPQCPCDQCAHRRSGHRWRTSGQCGNEHIEHELDQLNRHELIDWKRYFNELVGIDEPDATR
jgi:hypothetical protein